MREAGKLRVAVCLSGQMRGFARAGPALIKHLLQPLGADVFIHTWSNIGVSNNDHRRRLPPPMARFLGRGMYKDFGRLCAAYPRVGALLNRDEPVSRGEIEQVYGPYLRRLEIEDYPPTAADEDAFFGNTIPPRLLKIQPKARWSRSMFYKIRQANRLKGEHEAANGFRYDLVIRLRPDLLVPTGLPAGFTAEDGVVYHRLGSVDPFTQMGDQLFLGTSGTMDRVTDLFTHLPEIYEAGAESIARGSYSSLYGEGLLFNYVALHAGLRPHALKFATQPGARFSLEGYVNRRRLAFADLLPELAADLAGRDRRARRLVATGLSRALGREAQGAGGSSARRRRVKADVALAQSLGMSASTALAAGILAQHEGDPAAAIEHLRAAIGKEPSHWQAYFWLGRALLAQGDHGGAVVALEKATGPMMQPAALGERASAFLWLARASATAGHWHKAGASMEVVCAIKPDDFAVNLEAAETLLRAGELYGALRAGNAALALQPKDAHATYIVAHATLALGGGQRAATALIGQLGLDIGATPETVPLLAPLALATYRKKRSEGSLELARRYLASGLVSRLDALKLARLFVKLDDPGSARTLLTRALAAEPDDAELAEALAALPSAD